MNRLTEDIKTMLQPKAALIAYKSEEYSHSSTNDHYYLELRRIDDNGNMGEGMPVTYDFLNKIAQGYADIYDGTPQGLIPDNMIYADSRRGNEKYIWFNPPQKRMMYFHKDLEIENSEYHIPGLIYMVVKDSLYVYAYKEILAKNRNKILKTKLYKAPFFNIYDYGVCLGIAKLEKPDNPSFTQIQEYWEKKFWLTEFTHLGGNGNPTETNLVIVTKAAKNSPFNENELKLANKTLNELIR